MESASVPVVTPLSKRHPHGAGIEGMSTRDLATRVCPRCESADTIRTGESLDWEYWRCYACGRTFDVRLASATPQRRATDKKRKVTR